MLFFPFIYTVHSGMVLLLSHLTHERLKLRVDIERLVFEASKLNRGVVQRCCSSIADFFGDVGF